LKLKAGCEVDPTAHGYPKLKQMVLAIEPKIKIDFKGQNHPVAYLPAAPKAKKMAISGQEIDSQIEVLLQKKLEIMGNKKQQNLHYPPQRVV